MKNRILSFILTFSLVAALLSGFSLSAFAAVEYDGGSGTQNDPYLISTAEQLSAFRDSVNSGKTTLCASLTANIDLQNASWVPIGTSSSGYRGTFDGNGYAIRNLCINKVSSGTSSGGVTVYGGGLFGVIGSKGTVKRVNVAGTISVTESVNVPPDLGTICGANTGTVEECFATVNISIPSLTVNSSRSGQVTVGAIAGVNNGTILNCYAVGTMQVSITNTKRKCPLYIGGLVGHTTSSSAKVQNCYSAVSISAENDTSVYCGGVIGYKQKGTYSNTYANKELVSALSGYGKLSSSSLMSTADMKKAAFADKLGSAFSPDTSNVNQGYPVLNIMVYDEESDWSQWFEDEAMGENINLEVYNRLIPAELKNRDLTKSITREEFCAVAVKLYEEMGGEVLDAETLTTPFTDTSSNAVKKAYAIGITNGTGATTFSPYNYISREDLATMLTRVYKALNLPGWSLAQDSQYTLDYSGTTPFADDASISAYAKPSVYFMVKNAIIKGTSATTFSPRNLTSAQIAIGYANASREQALIMAVRMFQKL